MKKQRRDPWQELKSRLIARRQGLGLTQEQLAALVFRGRTTVVNWESGHNSVPAEGLLDWIAALGLRVLLAPARDAQMDVGVGSTGETRIVDVEIAGFGFPMSYDEADELRDMLTDALEHIDECDRRKVDPAFNARMNRLGREPVEASSAWNLYLQSALNRRAR